MFDLQLVKQMTKKSKTDTFVKFTNWSKTKQQVKNNTDTPERDKINATLRKIENYLLEQHNNVAIEHKFI